MIQGALKGDFEFLLTGFLDLGRHKFDLELLQIFEEFDHLDIAEILGNSWLRSAHVTMYISR